MLVLSRRIGESLVIEDTEVRVHGFDDESAELHLRKITGGAVVVASIHRSELLDACYDCQLTLVAVRDDRIRVGIVSPEDVAVYRKEVFDALP